MKPVHKAPGSRERFGRPRGRVLFMRFSNNRSKPLSDPSPQAQSARRGIFSRFTGDRSGAIALIFGIALIPMLIGAGIAVDLSRAFLVKNRLGQALDAAALAVGSSTLTDEDELKQLAQDYFNANYSASELGTPGVLNVTITNKRVSIQASAELDTTLLALAGHHKLNVNNSVEVVKELRNLEVVMVLDNTGSMNSNGKLAALKTAATELVNTLVGEQPETEMLKFGLVPFSAAVNVGSQYASASWIDTTKLNSLHGIQFRNTANVFTMYDKITNKSWNGCVEARPAPHDVLDTVPTTSNGDSLWVPYFAPDEPDNGAAEANGYSDYPNNYLNDNVAESNDNLTTRQNKKNKYNSQSVSGSGPHYNCANAPLTPLTSDKTEILSSINNMAAGGYTLIPLGLGWGWRVASPDEPFTEGADYDDDDTDKAIILLTDGLNNIGSTTNHNNSRYNGYGYVAQGRLGTTSANAAQSALDDRTTELCNNIKAQGILIYTITFQLNDTDTQNLFRNCATDASKYFNSPSNSQLQATFQAIANDLGKLRIAR